MAAVEVELLGLNADILKLRQEAQVPQDKHRRRLHVDAHAQCSQLCAGFEDMDVSETLTGEIEVLAIIPLVCIMSSMSSGCE